LSSNPLLWSCQEACLPRCTEAQSSPLCLTVRVPIPLLKSENTRLPTEGKKAVTCDFVGGSRGPASPKCTEPQHFPPHLAVGVSSLPSLRVRIPAPPLSDNLLFCRW
jgi:hypothetical protein